MTINSQKRLYTNKILSLCCFYELFSVVKLLLLLAVISIPQQSSTQEAMKGPLQAHMWDLNNHTNWNVLLSEHPSISLQISVGCDYLCRLYRREYKFRKQRDGKASCKDIVQTTALPSSTKLSSTSSINVDRPFRRLKSLASFLA